MSEKKIVVPEGMMLAVRKSGHDYILKNPVVITSILEAALRWLSENPIIPTGQQGRDLDGAWLDSKSNLAAPYHQTARATEFGAIEWQRRMFLAPEPELPDAIKDLKFPCFNDGQTVLVSPECVNDHILEAYRRGQKAGLK